MLKIHKRYLHTVAIFSSVILLIIPCCISISLAAAQKTHTHELNRLVRNGGYIVKKGDKTIVSQNIDTFFIPASTWKIATALAALQTLGEDFRFTTDFYINDNSDLYIKGNGDPYLISEEITAIIQHLKKQNVTRINRILLDNTAFQVTSPPDGAGNSLNPYDVANGALAANFNTVNLTVSEKGAIHSAEKQTPTLPIMLELGKNMPPGIHRINISLNTANVLTHVGQLFRAFQQKENIPGTGEIALEKVPENLPLIYTHLSSKNLPQIIEALMLYSNNYMTNQLFLTLGARYYGYPATWDKARKFLDRFLAEELFIDRKNVRITEGSGLSRNNLITPRAMLSLLERFKPYAQLLPLDKGRRIKSGTLTDVYSYIGYFQENGGPDSFVLILNQSGNHRDKVMELLEKIYITAE